MKKLRIEKVGRLTHRNCKLGKNVVIKEPVNIYGCEIGDNTFIGPFVEIQKGVTIGKNCRIQSHTFICENTFIGDNVFIGHGVMFTNDKYPKVNNKKWEPEITIVSDGVSIGSNATLLSVMIGENALVGAGSVVTKGVGPKTTVVGNPARELK